VTTVNIARISVHHTKKSLAMQILHKFCGPHSTDDLNYGHLH